MTKKAITIPSNAFIEPILVPTSIYLTSINALNDNNILLISPKSVFVNDGVDGKHYDIDIKFNTNFYKNLKYKKSSKIAVDKGFYRNKRNVNFIFNISIISDSKKVDVVIPEDSVITEAFIINKAEFFDII